MKKSITKKIFTDFQTEYGESISFPLSVFREYPKKNSFIHNEAVYYVYKLFDRLVIERTVTENEFFPSEKKEK